MKLERESRTPASDKRDQRPRTPHGEELAKHAAHECQQHTLGEELPDEAPAASSHGQAHGHLGLTSVGARQQQIGEISAADEQHQRHDNHEDAQR